MNDSISISSVDVGDDAIEELVSLVRSGMLAQGPKVAELESLFADVAGTQHAVAVSSGTAALVLALEAVGIGPGDEVVTTPFTFVATLNAVLGSGATARFADIGDDFNVNPAHVASRITDRTRAILPVHLYGLPAEMNGILDIAAEHDLLVVEDAAQAVGASVGGRRVGSFGIGCFSLYATKNVTTGEGGIVTTDSDEIAHRLRCLRNQGMRTRYEYESIGYNHRLTDVQAVLGLGQMRRLDQINKQRAENARMLSAGLAGLEGLVVPGEVPGRVHVWHQFTVRVTSDAPITRAELGAMLAGMGIATGVYYPRPVFDYPVFRDHPRVTVSPTPNASRASAEVLSLPVHPSLATTDIDRIIEGVRRGFGA